MTEPHAGAPHDEEELERRFEEEMRRIRVEDVLLQTTVTLINLAAQRLGLTGDAGTRDVGQARLAIEGARALTPLLPAEAQGQLREALSQLQLAFAREARAGGEQPEGEHEGEQQQGGGPAGDPERPHGDPLTNDAERAKARAKIWTPPGSTS